MAKHSHTTMEWDHDGNPEPMKSDYANLAMILAGDMKFTQTEAFVTGSFRVAEFAKVRDDYSTVTATLRTWDCHGAALGCK